MQRIRAITPTAILRNYSPLYFLLWKLCSLHNSEIVQGIFMKLGTNLKHGQKIGREQDSWLHQGFNRIMPFEVFSLEIVSTV